MDSNISLLHWQTTDNRQSRSEVRVYPLLSLLLRTERGRCFQTGGERIIQSLLLHLGCKWKLKLCFLKVDLMFKSSPKRDSNQDGRVVGCGAYLLPWIHQRYIYKWNSSCRTHTEHQQKTSDTWKGKKGLQVTG